jgi:hypothetical protein
VDLRVIQGSKKARYNVLTNKDAREILQKALALSDNERAVTTTQVSFLEAGGDIRKLSRDERW